jgi:hypothetical protein
MASRFVGGAPRGAPHSHYRPERHTRPAWLTEIPSTMRARMEPRLVDRSAVNSQRTSRRLSISFPSFLRYRSGMIGSPFREVPDPQTDALPLTRFGVASGSPAPDDGWQPCADASRLRLPAAERSGRVGAVVARPAMPCRRELQGMPRLRSRFLPTSSLLHPNPNTTPQSRLSRLVPSRADYEPPEFPSISTGKLRNRAGVVSIWWRCSRPANSG